MRAVAVVGIIFCLLAGCKKPAGTPTSAPAAPAASSGGGSNTNFVPGGGAVQNARQAGRRTAALSDFNTLGQLIEVAYSTDGRMPDPASFKQSLQRDAPNVYAAINDGSIICVWTASTPHGGLWAYETEADTKGGIALVGGRATRVDSAEMQKLLGR